MAEIIVFGSLRICYINLMAKFDLFILVEFCTSSIIFQNKIKGPQGRMCIDWIEQTVICERPFYGGD